MRTLLLTLLLASAALASDIRQQLLDADTAFAAETARRGLDGWMNWFAPDARVNGRTGIVQGPAELRKHYAGMFAQKDFSIRWAPIVAEASADGSLGYTLGAATISFTNEKGEKVERSTRYLTVWKRQADGRYKVVTDMGS